MFFSLFKNKAQFQALSYSMSEMQVFPSNTSNDYKTSTVLITADEFIYDHLKLQKAKKKNENIPKVLDT